MEHGKVPQFIAQAEALVGTNAYYDAARERELRDGGISFTPETTGLRGLLYVSALRFLVPANRDMRTRLDAPQRAFYPSRLAALAAENATEISDIARRLAVINTAEHTLHEQEASFIGGLRPHLHPYLHDVIDFIGMRPSKITVTPPGSNGDPYETYIQGATVEAPTGTGKTVLMARTAVALGVGRPIENIENDQRRVRALIIVPSQTIVEQMIGKVGDDTFRRFAPGIKVGGYYEHQKDDEADTVVITIEQFTKNFRNGSLNGQRFDVCMVDEAHHATQPVFQKILLEHWLGGPIIGFTATPQYYPGKDVRDLLPVRIFHGDMLDFIQSEEDIVNAAQLFMVRVAHDRYLTREVLAEFEGMSETDIDQFVIREATADFLMPLLAEGRRGLVFCAQAGGAPSHYAMLMAKRLAAITLPDDSHPRTATAGTLNRIKSRHGLSNQDIRNQYRNNELDIITAVEWGREGLNEDIDFVVTTGDTSSALKYLQMIGRGTRLSSRFPITIYSQIYVPAKYRYLLSLFGVLGFEKVEQGKIIGKKPDGDDKHEHSRSTGGMPISAFPPRIYSLLGSIQNKTVGEALLHPDLFTVVPENFIEYEAAIADVPGPPETIKRHLRDKLGFKCIGRYERLAEGGRKFVFYFEEAVQAYLNERRGLVARVDLQRRFGGVDVGIVEAHALECNATPIDWFYYTGIYIPHYKPTDAANIENDFHKTPPADPTDFNRPKLAAAAGISENFLANYLTGDEISQTKPKRTKTANGKIRILQHWTAEQAVPIIERLKEMTENEGIPKYLVPMQLAKRHIKSQYPNLLTFAESIGEPSELVRIARSGRPPRVVTWRVLQSAEQEFGVRHSDFTIDYSRLPLDRTDKDPAKLAYAQKILEKLAGLPEKATR
jgi:superfamily II DNA or RNA helicase